MSEKEEYIRARCSADMIGQLEAIAQERDWSVSLVIRTAIKEYLDADRRKREAATQSPIPIAQVSNAAKEAAQAVKRRKPSEAL